MSNSTQQTEAQLPPSDAAPDDPAASPSPSDPDRPPTAAAPEAVGAEHDPQPDPLPDSQDREEGAELAAGGADSDPGAGVAEPDGTGPEEAKERDSDGHPETEAASTRPGLPPELLEPLRAAQKEATPVEGTVIGWNQGGFHVVVDSVPAFCPRSEMEVSRPKAPKSYIDNSFKFLVLRIEEEGRRIVLSRAAVQRHERAERRKKMRDKITPGAVLTGRVASLTDFGAFVDLGGVQGLVHVSEISRERVDKPGDVLKMGQTVEVKVLKVESGGRRISLSMKALEPDPWAALSERLAAGTVVTGKVEKVAPFGVFIELEPGVTGLLPQSTVKLPVGTSLARRFPVGKQVRVQVMSVDRRRRRISLTLEGSSVEGSRTDYEEYKRGQESGEEGGFNALAVALRKARQDGE